MNAEMMSNVVDVDLIQDGMKYAVKVCEQLIAYYSWLIYAICIGYLNYIVILAAGVLHYSTMDSI